MRKRNPTVLKKSKKTSIESTKSNFKNLSDAEFRIAFTRVSERCLEERHLGEEEYLMWQELVARIMKNKTNVTAIYSPKDFLEKGTSQYYQLSQNPRDSNFSVGSINLLPCGYFSDDRKEYGDFRFQRYWLNAFFGPDGNVVLSIAMFLPYDRKVSTIRWGKKARDKTARIFGPDGGHSIQALTNESPIDAKNDAYNALSHAVRINPGDEGSFWKALRLEMIGVMENYMDRRTRDLDRLNFYDKSLGSEEGRERMSYQEGVVKSLGRKLKDTVADALPTV